MTHSSLPKGLLELLRTTNPVSMRAILLTPNQPDGRLAGTAFFDPLDETLSVRGDFFAEKTHVPISEAARCQLLLANSSIWLNVIICPVRKVAGKMEHLRFELER